jgi:phage host-nuclease inhibitor protein Gam
MARTTRPSVSIPVPANLSEANTVLFRVSALSRSVLAIEADYVKQVTELRKAVDAKVAPLVLEREQISLGLQIFAGAHRETLLVQDEKTVRLSGGSFGWRFTPPKVTLGRGGEEKALANLRELELTDYIRIKESLDKEALLRDRPSIAGIKYTQKEEFFLDPVPAVDDAEACSNVIRLVQGL